jgi:thiamine biosynthesis lipoprotein
VRPLLALALALAAGAARAEVTLSDGRYAMGTILEITLVAESDAAGRRTLEELYAIATRLERAMTSFDEASDLMRLNRAAAQGPVDVDPELVRVLALAVDFAARTQGAFDVTVGPLVVLWKRAAERGRPPDAAELAEARRRVGSDAIRVLGPTRAALERAGARVELGGIAKGYALDRMADALRAAGVRRALLSFGQSSLQALGAPLDGDGWRLLVRRPDGGFAGVATLRDQAVSVSGSLGQFTEIAGRRYGHVLDPRSGEPLIRPLEAMVLCPTAALGEAASKALLVLGERDGVALLGSLGCEGLLVGAGGARHATPGFEAASRFEAADGG